ncbi:MAG TPA: hypothetical protein VKU01_08205 [Bryobacteraceae bacterium]|nr:hypothetical protein [Bryobacteraceae bacterium]
MKSICSQFRLPVVWGVGLLLLTGTNPVRARIIGGRVTGGTAQTAGGIFVKLAPPLPNPFGPPDSVGQDNFQSPNLYGFDESQNIVIPSNLITNVGLNPIPAGTTVASHYVFFDPLASQHLIGTVDFDANIIAILTSTTTLDATDFLTRTGVNYLSPEARGLEPVDMVTIVGPRQIKVDFSASSPGDYIRVLTATSATANGIRFVPVPPCRVVDTRGGVGPLGGPSLVKNATRDFPIAGNCGLPQSAQAYSLNVTTVSAAPLGYLSIWPTGQSQPLVSTLNAPAGGITANAAIVPVGATSGGVGSITVFATDVTDMIIDVDGYFDTSASGNSFFTATPCRVVDTRGAAGSLGGPQMAANTTRSFPVPQSSCGVPPTATAYSTNVTVVPAEPLGYLTIWPTGQMQPFVSTLNSPNGAIVANAALVPSGSGGSVDAFVTNRTDMILDINGYFGVTGANGLAFYTVTPCRVVDTRGAVGSLGGPTMAGNTTRSFPVQSSTCGVPQGAKAYSLNVTVVPQGALSYLTLFPTGQTQPVVSTLNSPQGLILANAAIVPAGTNGAVTVYVTDKTDVIVDINGYFAP